MYIYKEKINVSAVLRIGDVYPGSRIRIPPFLVIPDPGSYIKIEVQSKLIFCSPDQMIIVQLQTFIQSLIFRLLPYFSEE
jgi:hypothetical protein